MGGIPDSFAYAWHLLPPTELPCPALTLEFVPSLTATCYAMFGCYPWDACYLLKGKKGAVNLVERVGVGDWEE